MMPTQPDPRYFDWGGQFQYGIQQSQDNRRRNAMLDLDQRQVGMQEQRFQREDQRYAQQEQERAAAMQAEQEKEGIGLKALAAARGDRQSAMEVLEKLGLPVEFADDPDAAELYGSIAEQYGGFQLPKFDGTKFGNVNPGDYTPDSLAQYAQTGNYADLVRQYAPQPTWIGAMAGGIGAIPRVPGGVGDPQMVVDPATNIAGAAALKGAEAGASATAQANVEAGTQNKQKANATVMWDAALGNLSKGMDSTATGPIVGRAPALTKGQQVADSSVASLAPILKQIFRVAGEGTFTDRDQAMLLDMIPTRKIGPEARAIILKNIDDIVKAKLGAIPTSAPANGTVRKFNPATGKIE